MKTLLPILSILLLASCSSVYKSGQTPDDLYASKPKVEVTTKNYEKNTGKYNEDYADNEIRMSIRNPRWRTLDYHCDCDCTYHPYGYGYNYNYGYYYNPYYYPYPVYNNNASVKFVNPKNTTIRSTNLGAYSNTITTNTNNPKLGGSSKTITIRGYNNRNTEKKYSNTDTYSAPRSESRTYTPSNNSSSNSSSNSSTPSRGTSVPMPNR